MIAGLGNDIVDCRRIGQVMERHGEHFFRRLLTEKEIAETKLVLLNSLDAVYDGLHGLEAWYLNEAIRGTWTSPEQVKAKVEAVTEQQIKEVLGLLHLNVVYKLTK